MGGHGGLNILPQKSWNVYGQKQRQKVQRDEETAAAAEDAALDTRLQGLRQGSGQGTTTLRVAARGLRV